jgi:endogenous inhibitor of DNA gyrase (YacG/DUF329 family)
MRKLEVGIECPACRKRVEVQINKTFLNTSKECPYCGTVFEVVANSARILRKAPNSSKK